MLLSEWNFQYIDTLPLVSVRLSTSIRFFNQFCDILDAYVNQIIAIFLDRNRRSQEKLTAYIKTLMTDFFNSAGAIKD